VPLAFAILSVFVQAPAVNRLQRWCRRVAAILIVVLLVLPGVLAARWGAAAGVVANDSGDARARHDHDGLRADRTARASRTLHPGDDAGRRTGARTGARLLSTPVGGRSKRSLGSHRAAPLRTSSERVYDALLMPGLHYTRRDRQAGRLRLEEESSRSRVAPPDVKNLLPPPSHRDDWHACCVLLR
jgi:hypothetical protein